METKNCFESHGMRLTMASLQFQLLCGESCGRHVKQQSDKNVGDLFVSTLVPQYVTTDLTPAPVISQQHDGPGCIQSPNLSFMMFMPCVKIKKYLICYIHLMVFQLFHLTVVSVVYCHFQASCCYHFLSAKRKTKE